MFYSTMIEIMGMLFGAMAALATVVIAWQLIRLGREVESENRTKRFERTLEILQWPESVSETFASALEEQSPRKSFEASKLERPKLFKALAYLETLATGIRSGVYDDGLAFSLLGDALPRFYFVVAKYIYQSRSEGTAPSLYIQTERLAREWRDRSPRESLNKSAKTWSYSNRSV